MSDTDKPGRPADGAAPPERPGIPGSGRESGRGGDGGFEVDPPQLEAHSRGTATVSQKIGTARDAARYVASGPFDLAYGALLSFFPPYVMNVEWELLKAMDAGMRVLRFASEQLADSGAEYTRMDETAADDFDGIGSELG